MKLYHGSLEQVDKPEIRRSVSIPYTIIITIFDIY